MKKNILFILAVCITASGFSQNVGIGTATPQGKLHIIGTADTTQLVIDAYITQSNNHPLIRLRDAAGIDLLDIHSDNTENAFIGRDAGRVNNASGGGINNTFIGTSSAYNNTIGAQNTAVGRGSLFYNVAGEFNTALGYKALFSNNGSANCALGSNALQTNQYGAYNTAVGYQALQYNSSGSSNTALGSYALENNTLGFDNSVVGSLALYANTNGAHNVAVGNSALFSNTSGGYNTAVGNDALASQSYSNGGVAYNSWNTAVGANSLNHNNPSINTSYGIENTAVGYAALYFNSNGTFNTAHGYGALYNNTTGTYNTATGNTAMYLSQNGWRNTADGYHALNSNVSGSENVAVGNEANVDLSNSNYNTVMGAYAHVQGSNDVAIGHLSYTNVNNLALLGNTTTTQCGGYADWSNFSDGRFKTNVDENVHGLDFIMLLRPVTYHMNVRALYELWGISPYGPDDSIETAQHKEDIDKAIANKESIRMSGFIAQEVEKAADETGYDFDGVIKPAHDKDHYRLAYGEFVVPLVKAMQEQQATIEEQKKIILSQQSIIDEMLSRLTVLEGKINVVVK